MRFRRWPRPTAYRETPRKRAAFLRKQCLEREALPLFADAIAARQHSVDEEMARRHVDSVRANLIDILTPEEFTALGDSLRKVRDALAMEGQAGDAD